MKMVQWKRPGGGVGECEKLIPLFNSDTEKKTVDITWNICLFIFSQVQSNIEKMHVLS